MSQNKSDDYDKLRAIWYQKLKDEGYNDIESDEDHLKTWSTKFASKKSQADWQAKATYYSMASNFLNDYPFENDLERIIWEYHANAISVRDIAITLNKAGITKTNRTTVWQTIKRLEAKMKSLYLSGYIKKYE